MSTRTTEGELGWENTRLKEWCSVCVRALGRDGMESVVDWFVCVLLVF
jgi:hypothetical protein